MQGLIPILISASSKKARKGEQKKSGPHCACRPIAIVVIRRLDGAGHALAHAESSRTAPRAARLGPGQAAQRPRESIGTPAKADLRTHMLVAVVGHGRSMKFFMGAVLGMDPAEAVDLPQPNTCINVLDWDVATGSFSKVALGIAEHWDGAGAT